MFLQQLLNGLTNGSIYALLAIGVTMIYKTLNMLNFAHGDVIMISAFLSLLMINLGMPIVLAIVFTVIIASGIGVLLERFVYRKLEYSSFVNLLIATVGVSYILKNTSITIWGSHPYSFPDIFDPNPINFNGFLILPQNIGIIVISVILVAILQLFFYKTKYGQQMRAAATDAEGAAMMGIDVNLCRMLTFGISSAFAAVAGILLAPMFFVSVDMGVVVGLKAFTAAVLGGFGNVIGAVLGGLLLGGIEALGATYISTAYKDVISFLVLFVVIYLKPAGLLAKKIEQKL